MGDPTETVADDGLVWEDVKDTRKAKNVSRICLLLQILGVLPVLLTAICILWFGYALATGGSPVTPVAVIVLLTVFMAIIAGINGALKKFSPLYALAFENLGE